MKKTITIYELLGLIKDSKAPKKIIYDGYTYEFLQNGCVLDDFNYFSIINGFLYNTIDFENHLNDEVEIIDEEEFEDIYNFCWNENYLFSNRQTGMTKEDRRLLDSNFKDIHDTINQLIKNQKKIIEKLNKSNNIQ